MLCAKRTASFDEVVTPSGIEVKQFEQDDNDWLIYPIVAITN
jgi:hypothetical protein